MHHGSGDRAFRRHDVRLLGILRGIGRGIRRRRFGIGRFRGRRGLGRGRCRLLLGGRSGSSGRLRGLLLLSRRGARRLRPDRFADAAAVGEPDHHHDVVRLLGVEQVARRRGPVIRLVAGIDADQSRIGAMLAQDADLGRVGECFFQPEGKPVGHRVAEHHDLRGRRDVGAPRRGRARGIDRRLVAAARSRTGHWGGCC